MLFHGRTITPTLRPSDTHDFHFMNKQSGRQFLIFLALMS